MEILQHIGRSIESIYSNQSGNVNVELLRALLLIEALLRTTLLRPEAYTKILNSELSILSSQENTNISSAVVLKAKKILLIIQTLIKHWEE